VGFDRFRVLALAYEGQAHYAKAAAAWLEASKQAQDDAMRRMAVEGAAQDLYLGGKLADARQVAGSLGDASDGLRERVAPRLVPDVLQALAENVPLDDPDHAWLVLRHAQAECASGKLATCTASAETASKSADAKISEEARRLLERVKAWNQVRPTRLGILLPQSGRFRELGEDAFESIQQAIKGESHIELVVRDTAGKAGLAAQGAEELILQEHVAAIVGPIGEIESRAAVMSSARFGVPHVVFSSKPGVAKDAPTALRMRLSPEEVVEALARYAVTELRAKRAAFLVPEQKGRRRQMIAFWDEFVRLGGEVRAVEFYEPEQKDFKPIMRKLLGATKPGTGTVDFDTLFIPDDALHVHHLVPFLKYFGLRMKTHPKLRTTKRTQPIQLLGVASWNSSAVIDPEGLTENAVFMNSFFHAPDDRTVDRFVRRFHKRYRRKPNAFQAEVYDTVKLVASAMKGLEGTDQTARDALMTTILGVKHHPGVTGHITILDDGTMVLKPRVLTIHLDDIRLRMSEDEEAHLRGGTGRRR
jgi:branched-chain amino acid transport system substrate-binding protein